MKSATARWQDRRAEAVRRDIVAAARRLFAERGYARTSMVEVAKAAGVAVQTVYAHVGGKPALLEALLEVVDRHGRVEEIQREIATSEDPKRVLALTAKLRRQLMEGAADVLRVLAEASPGDAEVARAWQKGLKKSHEGCRRIARRLAQLGALRDDEKTSADALYGLLTPAIYGQLVEDCGWSPDQFEAWLAETLQRAVLA